MEGISEREAEVLDYIDNRSDELLSLLQKLIASKPVNPPGLEERAARILRPRLLELGFQVDEYTEVEGRPNIVATLSGEGDGPTLLATSHLDVVPVNNPDKWPCDPFSGDIIDGRLYGRGAVDHKTPMVAMLGAIEAIKKTEGMLAGDLVFLFDSDEEEGGEHGMKYLLEEADIQADMGIYSVTQSMTDTAAKYHRNFGKENLIRANCGNLVFKIEIDGRIVHPKAPAESISAGENAARLLPGIQSYCDEISSREDPLVGHPSASLTKFESDGRTDRPNSRVTIYLHRYVTPNENPEAVKNELPREILRIAERVGLREDVEVSVEKEMPYMEVPETHELVTTAARAIELVRNRKPTITGTPSQTGVAWIVQKLQIPMILFGFGNVDLHHAEPEWVAPRDVVDTAKAYALTYESLIG